MLAVLGRANRQQNRLLNPKQPPECIGLALLFALQLGSIIVAKVCLEKQRQNLREFAAGFATLADPAFQSTQPTLMQSFLDMVAGMDVKVSNVALSSFSFPSFTPF